jgi:putative ABC transport system permease protein
VTGRAVLTAASAGVTRRLVQTAVIFLVLAAGATACTLGLTLAASANEGFDTAFAAAHGADLAVTINLSKATPGQVAATRHLPGVTQAAGPYTETYILYGEPYRNNSSAAPPAGRSLPPGVRTEKPSTAPSAQPPKGAPSAQPPKGRHATGQPSPGTSALGRLIPYGEVDPSGQTLGQGLNVLGRTSTGGSLDHLDLMNGRMPTRRGEIVLSADRLISNLSLGEKITITSAPGQPKLTLVGIATSTTNEQRDWVVPSEIAALRPKGAPPLEQMLYTFTHAATTGQISADLAQLRHALPAGAVVNWTSWLTGASVIGASAGLNTPFAVAFGIIGLVLAVLITASVASAAVVAGYRRIGVLKSIGFTPVQVAAAYLVQLGIPALAGAIAGTVLGNYWVVPLLNGGSGPHVGVPVWINLTVPLGMLALTMLAALVPALRAGRLSAVAAIAAGQAPRAGHGYGVHRLAGRLALPRPVSMGLAAPFTRPARTAVTLAAVTFGLTAVVLATGLDTSIAKINAGANEDQQTQNIETGFPPGKQPLTPRQQQAIAAALRAQPGTQTYLRVESGEASVPGMGSQVPVTAFGGNAAVIGWDITSGAWYTGPGQVVVNIADRGTAGLAVGQTIRMTIGGKQINAKITGEAYAPSPDLGDLLTSQQTLTNAGASLPLLRYEAVPKPGIDPPRYQAALDRVLGPGYTVIAGSAGITTGKNHNLHGVGLSAEIDTSLIRLLTIMVAVLAGLGVLNTVLMLTRERVHDLGIFKAVGMTPRQAITMVTCWVIAPAIGAAIIALPAGVALQDAVIHGIARAEAPALPPRFGVATPASIVHVYTPAGLALLVLAGLAIAVAGALGPAAWAAVSRTTTALRAE